MTFRTEFTTAVRRAALKRANGICECGCGQPFGDRHPKERPQFDHDLPAYLGGTATLENCKVLRTDCHRIKTSEEDTPQIVKTRRILKKQAGLGFGSRKIAGSKGTGMRKRMDGSVLWLGHGR